MVLWIAFLKKKKKGSTWNPECETLSFRVLHKTSDCTLLEKKMVLLISLAILSYLHGFNLEPSLIRRPFGVQFGILPIEEQNKEPRMSSRVKLSFQRTYFLNFNSFNDLSGEFRLLEGKKKSSFWRVLPGTFSDMETFCCRVLQAFLMDGQTKEPVRSTRLKLFFVCFPESVLGFCIKPEMVLSQRPLKNP